MHVSKPGPQIKKWEPAPHTALQPPSHPVRPERQGIPSLNFQVTPTVTASQVAGLFSRPQRSVECMAFTPTCFRTMVAEYIASEFADEEAPWKAAFERYSTWKFDWSSKRRIRVVSQRNLTELVLAARLALDGGDVVADIVAVILNEYAAGNDYLTLQQFVVWVGLRGTTTA